MKRWLSLLLLPSARRMRVQPHSVARRAGRVGAEPNRGAATAPRRPDRKSRQHSEGLRHARRDGLRPGCAGPCGIDAGHPDARRGADGERERADVTGALGRLMVSVEAYPTLKADKSFIMLQDELTGTENRIAVSRNDYNQAVNAYNSYIRQFPAVVTAKMTGAQARGSISRPQAERSRDRRRWTSRSRRQPRRRRRRRAQLSAERSSGLRRRCLGFWKQRSPFCYPPSGHVE